MLHTAIVFVAENVKELVTRAHPDSEDLASGFAMSRFLVLLEEDRDLAIGVRRSSPQTLNEAVQEAIHLECINNAVHHRNVHVSAPINLDHGVYHPGVVVYIVPSDIVPPDSIT